MRKIFLFMIISLDGFFEGKYNDLSWHNVDEEFNKFAVVQMQEAGAIIFGRKTYELMESFWPSYQPVDIDNESVRHQMNILPKYVFSRNLQIILPPQNFSYTRIMSNLIPFFSYS